MNKDRTAIVNVKDALDLSFLKEEGIKYGWIQSLSQVQLNVIDKLVINEDELIEARFFSQDKEIHVFQYDDESRAIKIERQEDDFELAIENIDALLKEGKGDYYEERQRLRTLGNTLTLRHYLETDEDGLARVCATVLCDCDLGGRG